jgi:hypothetical protein
MIGSPATLAAIDLQIYHTFYEEDPSSAVEWYNQSRDKEGVLMITVYILGVMPFWNENTLRKECPKRGLIV